MIAWSLAIGGALALFLCLAVVMVVIIVAVVRDNSQRVVAQDRTEEVEHAAPRPQRSQFEAGRGVPPPIEKRPPESTRPASLVPPSSAGRTPPPIPAPGIENNQPAIYQWNTPAGGSVTYGVTITGEFQDVRDRSSGRLHLFPQGRVSQSVGKSGNRLPQAQSGSGVFITPTMIATSSMLIERADRITVFYQGREFSAKVHRIQDFKNLAILEIDEPVGKAPHLTKVEKEHPEEELSLLFASEANEIDVLTTSISGTRSRGNLLEQASLRSTLKPEHWGSPVVSGDGFVLGIISFDDANFNQPLLIPIRQVLEWPEIADRGGSAAPDAASRLDQIKHATVGIGVQRASDGHQTTQLRYEIQLHQDRSRPRRGIRPPLPFEMTDPFSARVQSDRGTITTNGNGIISAYTGEEHLPYLLGPAGLAAIEPIPSLDQDHWHTETRITIQHLQNVFDGLPMGFDPFGPSRTRIVGSSTGTETVNYQVTSRTDHEVVITKTYSMNAPGTDSIPSLRLTGTGTIRFDRRAGLISANDFDGHFEMEQRGTSVRFPIEKRVRLIPPEQLALERTQREEHAAELARQRATPITDAEIEKVIADLDSNNIQRRHSAMNLLQSRRPEEVPLPIAAALVRQVTIHKRYDIQTSNLLAQYHHPDLAEEYLDIFVSNPVPSVREATAKLIVQYPPPDMLDRLMHTEANNRIVSIMKSWLEQQGQAAEPILLRWLGQTTSPHDRREIVMLLEKVGGPDSLEPLEALLKERLIGSHVRSAINAIKNRHNL